jgi:hypothetical protein
MKEYPKNYENTTTDVNSTTFVDVSKDKAEPADEVAGFSRTGTLKNTHIIANDSVLLHDRFLDICFREWELFLQDYYLNRLERSKTPPFTPTDYLNFREP